MWGSRTWRARADNTAVGVGMQGPVGKQGLTNHTFAQQHALLCRCEAVTGGSEVGALAGVLDVQLSSAVTRLTALAQDLQKQVRCCSSTCAAVHSNHLNVQAMQEG